MRFNAAVLHEVGGPPAIDAVEAADLHPTEVLVRLCASGLCHTDLEVIQGSLHYPLPIVLGHEGAGVVEAVGRDVTLVKPGDHVICSWNPSCGHCFYCDRGQPILCEVFASTQPKGHLMDGTSRLSLDGVKLHHFSAVSSHAEYCVVPESGAVPIPFEMPFDRACLIGCGVMTGVGGAWYMAEVRPGEHVAVVGCGAVGLNAVQGARMAQAETVIAIDVNERKLELARTLGATHTVDTRNEDAVEVVRGLTAGRGADCVIECAGNEAALRQTLEVARPGARVIILGKTNVDVMVSLRFGSLMGEKRIIRSSYGGARPRRDFPLLSRCYLEGELKLDELITRRIKHSEINEGFAAMEEGDLVRVVIVFDD